MITTSKRTTDDVYELLPLDPYSAATYTYARQPSDGVLPAGVINLKPFADPVPIHIGTRGHKRSF